MLRGGFLLERWTGHDQNEEAIHDATSSYQVMCKSSCLQSPRAATVTVGAISIISLSTILFYFLELEMLDWPTKTVVACRAAHDHQNNTNMIVATPITIGILAAACLFQTSFSYTTPTVTALHINRWRSERLRNLCCGGRRYLSFTDISPSIYVKFWLHWPPLTCILEEKLT